jgi:hypothetical protein
LPAVDSGAAGAETLAAVFLAAPEVFEDEALLALTIFCWIERSDYFARANCPHGKLAGTKAAEASKRASDCHKNLRKACFRVSCAQQTMS